MQFFENVLAGGSPERALIKGGSLALKGIREPQAAKAAAEATAKAAGAVGDATKAVGVGSEAGALMRQIQAGKRAWSETWASVRDAKLAQARKIADAAHAAAKAAGATFDDALSAYSAAYREALDKISPYGDETENAASKAAKAAKAASINAVAVGGGDGKVGERLRKTQAAKGAGGATTVADEAAGAASEVAGVADETAKAADETAKAADETAKAAGKGKGLFSRLIEGAANTSAGKAIAAGGEAVANSTTGKILGKAAKVAKPVLKFGARAAGPALDVIDVAQYFGGNPITGKSKEEVREKFQSDYETLGQRFFAPKSLGEFAGAVGDAASIPKTALGAKESVSQLLKSQRGARESEAALANMENIYKAIDDRRREMYPDEEFAKLPRNPKERAAAGLPEDTPTQSEVKNMIRNEFRKAGAKF